ncbi:MAG: AAA family ATPase, partial [Pyrinomonadaceae bacterium]
MHDVAVATNKERAYPLPRRANECIADPGGFRPPAKLFDECWREGDLALLFAPPAMGKSILAVQIAEALARGEPIDGLDMPEDRHRVLYVDLVHSDEQFHSRRTHENGRTYRFSDSFHRDAPPPDLEGGLIEWLREVVRERRYRAVIIDDLTAIRTTYDGTRETLRLMRELRSLKNELGISILVLTQSRPPRSGEVVSESNLFRSRVLCDAADSVFAIGRHPRQTEWLFLTQVRSRNAPIAWHRENSPFAQIFRRDDGLLVWQFDERFDPKLDAETLHLVRIVKGMQTSGLSIRKIGLELGITRSRVERLLRKWRPSHGVATPDAPDGDQEPDNTAYTAENTGADIIPEDGYDDDDEDEYLNDEDD